MCVLLLSSTLHCLYENFSNHGNKVGLQVCFIASIFLSQAGQKEDDTSVKTANYTFYPLASHVNNKFQSCLLFL